MSSKEDIKALAAGGNKGPRPGRPPGALNKSTMVAKAELEALVALMRPRLKSVLARTARDKPESYVATYVAALKHMAPPARAPEPGTEDKPMVIEVRQRGGDSASTHQSEAASAAAHLRRVKFTESEDDPE